MGNGGSKSEPPPRIPVLKYHIPYNVIVGNSEQNLRNTRGLYSQYQPVYEQSDPAKGCNKTFEGTYRCGSGDKKSTGPISGAGIATFDCRTEHNECTNHRLEITTSGEVRFTDRTGKLIPASDYVSSKFISGTTYQTNESLNPSPHLRAQVQELNEIVRYDNLPNLKRKFVTFMHPSQSLNQGEYICSATGNCFMVLTTDGKLEVCALKIKSNPVTEGSMQVMKGSHTVSHALYELDGINVENLGKVANISIDGKRRMYSNSQLSLGTKYIEITGKDAKDRPIAYDNPGESLESVRNDTGSIDFCFQQCSSRPDCGGFAVSKSDPDTCYLKTADMFPVGMRVPSTSTQLYKRLYTPKLQKISESCAKPDNTNVVAIDSVLFDHYPTDRNDPRMTRSTLCGVDQIVETQSSAFADASANLTSIYDRIMAGISAMIKKRTIYNLIRDDPKMNVGDKIRDYATTTNEIGAINEREETIRGTEEDTRIALISETYKYILWSILAIGILIAIVLYGDVGSGGIAANISSVTDLFKSSSPSSSSSSSSDSTASD
jgi:hypothetical protein